MLAEGHGPPIRAGQVVVVDVDMDVGARDYLDTLSTRQPTSAVLDGTQVSRSWDRALVGRRPGARVRLVSPSGTAFGPDGRPPANVPATERMTLTFDVIGGYDRTARVAPFGGFAFGPFTPGVSRPVRGAGAVVRRGDRVVVQWAGTRWEDARPFASTFGAGPQGFLVEPGAVLPGWTDALEGARVGDRVLLLTESAAVATTPGGMAAPAGRLAYVFDVLDVAH
ncbi:FKBP-type peptidyl-prolyl cis-trans isomerase [Herbidospora daliensis]|uniref:FKBP-type peptidyl-prolyl cis-trans isomerase n=1 Tax=Herbidospora daliensis TaxID=295585 RepID=UPI00078219EF|nr:FKBP-type peptidyl-prolyl cis-trans isomerase [Herbidospora daliensis]